jgi:hypothetical protein
MDERCEYCQWSPDAWYGCRSFSPAGYLCSREAGHDGPHVACGGDKHALANWGDEEKSEPGDLCQSLQLAVRGMLEFYEDGLSCMQSEGFIDGNQYEEASAYGERAQKLLALLSKP